MNNITNSESGERLSFYKLFSLKKYRVLIPIIQRDYAQGRKTTKEIRNNFLNALYNYLDENKPNRDLDFVYGSLSETNNIIDFIPLDGQQRLTTLYLLHWYLYQISTNSEKREEFKSALLKDDESMFTYETRRSSAEFCNSLMSNPIDFNTLLESDRDLNNNSKNNNLSKTIKNCAWFYLTWQYDPTIQSMLTMLDAIHSKFAGRKEFFERLLDIENPVITFLFMNLQDFKLTDDLYIKMNSRGMPLTEFENFKAKFEHFLSTIRVNREFCLTFNSAEKNTSIKEYFSHNIDTKWANLFWKYRTLQNRSNTEIDDTFDDELMNFIRVIFTNQYAMSASSKERDNTLEYLLGTSVAKKNKEYSDVISFNKYEELKALSTEGVLYLIDAFDSFANGNDEINLYLPEEYKFYFHELETFENALMHNFDSNHQRLCFHAYVRFLITNENDFSGIDQWMRVIHNLTHPDNTIIDSATEVASAIQSIEELLPHSNRILTHLQSNQHISTFSSWQIKEEKVKAQLILKDRSWQKKIEEVEKHRYFNGQIGFILEFAGILKAYDDMNGIDHWNKQQNTEYFNKFSDYAEKASKVFEESYESRKNNKDYVFERAVLTKGDYLTFASQYRKNLLSTNLVKNNIKRDHSWKRLLRISEADSKWTEKRLLVKEVFDDNRFNINSVEDSLKLICKDKTDSWRDYLISYPNLINYCNQGFIRIESESNILLYGESQSNHLHVEMFTYSFWKNIIEPNKNSYEPFKRIYYQDVKSIDDKASIIFKDFCYNRIHYQVNISCCKDNKTQIGYEISFKKSKGDTFLENYGETIKNILSDLDFNWNNNDYFFTTNNSDVLLDKLRYLTKMLKNTTDRE